MKVEPLYFFSYPGSKPIPRQKNNSFLLKTDDRATVGWAIARWSSVGQFFYDVDTGYINGMAIKAWAVLPVFFEAEL